jgi:hypothetical protein
VAVRLVQVNLKARDDAAIGRFWAEALGWVASGVGNGATSAAPAGFVWTDPAAPIIIDVIAVPDPATVRYRAHLELATRSPAHQAELVARLRARGATPAGTATAGTATGSTATGSTATGAAPGVVLADPEGNRFCVRDPHERDRDTGPIAAVVVDCADPPQLARFWAEAMGWAAHETSAERAVLRAASGAGPWLEFVRLPHLSEVRHRAHLDLVPGPGDTQAAEVARLRALGATPADVGAGAVSWTVLADPEGNEFCVLAPG